MTAARRAVPEDGATAVRPATPEDGATAVTAAPEDGATAVRRATLEDGATAVTAVRRATPVVSGAVTVRPATLQDLGTIMALERMSFPSDAWSEAMMREELTSPHGWYVVQEKQGRLVGYAGLRAVRGAKDADVQTIAVAEASRGRGQGRMLLHALLAEAARRAVAEVFLEVRADNAVAQALYEAEGFVELARRPRYYQPDGVDAVVMRVGVAGWADARRAGGAADAADPGAADPGVAVPGAGVPGAAPATPPPASSENHPEFGGSGADAPRYVGLSELDDTAGVADDTVEVADDTVEVGGATGGAPEPGDAVQRHFPASVADEGRAT